MRNEAVLIVDDSPDIRAGVAEILKGEGFAVDLASDGQEAIEKCALRNYDVVLTDLAMPRKDGLAVLEFVQEKRPATRCIIVTGYGSISGAVDAIRAGAFDYLAKPVRTEELLTVVERAIVERDGVGESGVQLRTEAGFGNIVGNSPVMQRIFDRVEKVAASDSTVLVSGESGTGKELVAHAIHRASERRTHPFVPVNCAAIPEELLESELFGHEKGAFTHAIRTRIGRFELADKGTIFLDEIGEMSPSLQVKLLRVIQERQFERVGGAKTIRVDIRIIAATNIDLEEAVRDGRFREDLYYRLNVIPIQMPPLRERQTDSSHLIEHFLRKFSTKKRVHVEGIDPEAKRRLLVYDWPGNVRELENMIERLVILADGPVITTGDLPEKILQATGGVVPKREATEAVGPCLPDDGLCLSDAVERFEKALILQALERTDWVKNRAAKLLQMNRTTLIEKMKKQKLMQAKGSAPVSGRARNDRKKRGLGKAEIAEADSR